VRGRFSRAVRAFPIRPNAGAALTVSLLPTPRLSLPQLESFVTSQTAALTKAQQQHDSTMRDLEGAAPRERVDNRELRANGQSDLAPDAYIERYAFLLLSTIPLSQPKFSASARSTSRRRSALPRSLRVRSLELWGALLVSLGRYWPRGISRALAYVRHSC
jgi:hypothetical protein